jgi:AraC-like DNA-binding protein
MRSVGVAIGPILDEVRTSPRPGSAAPPTGRPGPLFHHSPLGHAPSAPVREAGYLVGDLQLSHVVHGPRGLRRTRRQVAADAVDDIAVQVHLSGSWRGHVAETSANNDPQHVGVLDLGCPSGAVTTAVDVIWVVVPRRRLQGAFRRGPALRGFDTQTPRGRVLRSCVAEAWSRLRTAPPEEARPAAEHVVDALRRALGPDDEQKAGDALEVAVKRHVLANLGDLGLGPEELAESFHCSRATLYRLFHDDGGVLTYLRDKRLDRCLDELLDPAAVGRSIGETATAWGFENPSHFHRLFTARFDVTPSAVKVRSGTILDARPGPVAASVSLVAR